MYEAIVKCDLFTTSPDFNLTSKVYRQKPGLYVKTIWCNLVAYVECAISDASACGFETKVITAMDSLLTLQNSANDIKCPSSVSWGKLPTKTTQLTSRIRTLTSTFAGLKEDTLTNDSLAADQR
ncbi:hypothetical protein TNCV_2696101 [Trichonephila clavipes]|nr:hypothetical protein TNCV_2696101 [Trichonephila clavipes]